ncbi:MAG: hypothetical protein LBV08_11020 [Clostridiales bacterium]|jgi:hypothetical protein|nr:hypothetical protein [Clostridiales bacterium]
MGKKLVSGLFLLLFLNVAVFAHSAPINLNGNSGYVAVRLTPKIYNNANSGLSDILIKDSNGEAVPYFINSNSQSLREDSDTYLMELINSYTKDDSFYFDYKLQIEYEKDITATSIEFSTSNGNFAKTVGVYGSYDNTHWDFIQSDKLYAIDDVSKLRVEFATPQKYTHYRFELANNLEQISFESVHLSYNLSVNETAYFIESLNPEFSTEEKDKATFINIKGLKNLRLFDITIESGSIFKRVASAPNISGKEIYNLTFNDITYTDTTLALDGHIPQEDTYVVKIVNNDDKPIEAKGIVVRYYADDVVFDGVAGESYTLDFGASPEKSAPVYDIVSYKDEILKSGVSRAGLGTVNFEEEAEIEAEARDYKNVFNIVVIIITVLLGVFIIFRLRRKEL